MRRLHPKKGPRDDNEERLGLPRLHQTGSQELRRDRRGPREDCQLLRVRGLCPPFRAQSRKSSTHFQRKMKLLDYASKCPCEACWIIAWVYLPRGIGGQADKDGQG